MPMKTYIAHKPCLTILPITIVTLLAISACSIKEVRHTCPIYLRILVDKFVEQGAVNGSISIRSNHSELASETNLHFIDFISAPYDRAASRQYSELSVIGGLAHSSIIGDTLYLDAHQCADRLYIYTEAFSMNEDEYTIHTKPHKQYCRLRLDTEAAILDDSGIWRFRLTAPYSAMNIFSLEPIALHPVRAGLPIEGEYKIIVDRDANGDYITTLPKQKTNEGIFLEAFLASEDSSDLGEKQYEIDLGRLFEEQGYSWDDPDLRDLSLKIEYYCDVLSIYVENWTEEDYLEARI